MDSSFSPDPTGLDRALHLLLSAPEELVALDRGHMLPAEMPIHGVGDHAVLDALAPSVLGRAQRLDGPLAFAHMDPPTPWLTWATTLWNARLNQNLLHPATAPVAREIERLAIDWLRPFFGMRGGHMVPGSTVANITAIWAAREVAEVHDVVAADTAHLSVEKAAHLLRLPYRRVGVDELGRLSATDLGDITRSCLVLTAGTTSTGAIDPLGLIGRAAWTHVDAAWAGPLRLSERHCARLSGIERADSLAISGHKWLFQPKESGIVLFRDAERAEAAVSFGENYLTTPNIGLLGSHGAVAVPLVALMWAWGRSGIANRIDRCMAAADEFAAWVSAHPRLELWGRPETGVVVWRSRYIAVEAFAPRLPTGLVSSTKIAGETWLRCVAANPNVDVRAASEAVKAALLA